MPPGFSSRIELKLTGVEEGSAVPVIVLAPTDQTLEGFDLLPHQRYFEEARDQIINTIACVSEDAQEGVHITLPSEYLRHFNAIGRGLHDREWMEFDAPGRDTPARLTSEVRNILLQTASESSESEVIQESELMQDVILRGVVPEADKEKMTFELLQVHGDRVVCPIPTQYRDTIIEAFMEYENDYRILVRGVGRFDLQNRLSGVESIDSVSILEPLDVPARLDELRAMKDGEYDGYGSAPSHEGLDWLSDTFEIYYPDDLPLPNTYPTPEGGLEMEWKEGSQTVIFGIDLATREGEWLQFDTSSDSEISRELDLDASEDWQWVSGQIRQMTISL